MTSDSDEDHLVPPPPDPENVNPNQPVENMEVHHHAHHTHQQRNWKSYFWEFLMLFLAVTLGFFVENQREHYIEHVRAKEFSKALVQDFQSDLVAIQEQKKTASMFISIADSLMSLSQKKLEGRTSSKFSFYTRFMYWTGPIIWNRATFEQIKNSGSLRYFRNQKLLEKLMKYEALIKIIEAEAYNHQVRGNLMVEQINQILDPLYHQELSNFFLMEFDSISPEVIENVYPSDPESLENRRDEIRELLNMIVIQQRNLKRDILKSWKEAEDLAAELIVDLKDEYHN